ncbi:unnamed protein product, partial [Prorocentrum cordatum]
VGQDLARLASAQPHTAEGGLAVRIELTASSIERWPHADVPLESLSTLKQEEAALAEARSAYHRGEPVVSDEEYDKLREAVRVSARRKARAVFGSLAGCCERRAADLVLPLREGKGTHTSTPSSVFTFLGLLGGPRCHRWIRLEILVRTHPRRGPGSSGIGTVWFPQQIAVPHWPPPRAARFRLASHPAAQPPVLAWLA